jgi:hypothetical protein
MWFLRVVDRRAETAAVSGLAANQRLQTKIKQIVAKRHNPTPAIAHDTPTDAKVTINAMQANTDRTLIGHLSKETRHRSRRCIDSARIVSLGGDFASNSSI